MQKQFKYISVYVSVVYTVNNDYREEKKNTKIYSGSPNVR